LAERIWVGGAVIAVTVLGKTGTVLTLLASATEGVIKAVTALFETGTVFTLFSSATERVIKAVTAFI